MITTELAFFTLIIVGIVSYFLTRLVRTFAVRYGFLDTQTSTPLLGGAAVFLSFSITIACALLFIVDDSIIELNIVSGILIGSAVLILGGALDDKYKLKARYQIVSPILASLIMIGFGLGQDNITNPLYFFGLSSDPLIHLKVWTIPFLGREITFFSDLFTFVWLMILMYATKLLDGLNGLVAGITVIGAMVLFFTSNIFNQPLPALLAIILTGSYGGFLPYNITGKIFLGESGSTIAGFLLGALSLIGPAKISITLLVLGLPILDLLWVMYERKFQAKTSPFIGDARHLHYKLIRSGLSEHRAVMLLWGISLAFGALGLVLQGIAYGALLLMLIALMAFMLFRTNRKSVFR